MATFKHASSDRDIAACFSVMAELRTHLRRESFVELIRLLISEGYQLACLEDAGQVVTVAGYQISTSLFMGKNLYVYDLVTADDARSRGHGAAMLDHLREIARMNGCEYMHLDSGTQRREAHKFYFREGMTVSSFHFDEKLS